MAELENEVDVQDTDYDLDVQDTQDEKIEEEITYEQALQWREEAKREREARQKAEKSIVEKKKELAKKTSTQSPIDIKEAVKQIREEEKFFEKNPEAESYREKIEEYKSKWLSLDEAYLLATREDRKVDELRWVYGKSIIQGDQTSWDVIKLVSVKEYDQMSDKQQDEYNDKTVSKFWAVKFK